MRTLILTILLMLGVGAWAERITFVSYNCENLFDTQHDTLKNDTDFTTTGKYRWTPRRYRQKLDRIGKVLVACGGEGNDWQMPDIAVLLEVENSHVLRDLVYYSALKGGGYKYVITDSPDQRGVDIAIIYSPLTMRLVASDTLRIPRKPHQRPTRDVIHAEFLTTNGTPLHVFGIHAPSRLGGVKQTEPYRIAVVRRIVDAIGQIRKKSPEAHIVVAGDFNDYSGDRSLKLLQQCGFMEVSEKALGLHHHKAVRGTYQYQGVWESLDHILVNEPLLPQVDKCYIFDAPWLLEQNKAGTLKPNRTFVGPTYHGGFSDHLPLVLRITNN